MWANLVSFQVWDLAIWVQIPASPFYNMSTKLKKTKSAGRFGARYGKRVRSKLIAVEEKQRLKQVCPICGKKGLKRFSKGIWYCKKCDKKFASDVYYLEE